MGCDRFNHQAAVGRKMARIIAGAGEDPRALGYRPPIIPEEDFVPVTLYQAIEAFVDYCNNPRLKRMAAEVKDYDKGIVLVYLCDIEMVVHINAEDERSRTIVFLRITGGDLLDGKLKQRRASEMFGKIWEKASAVDRIMVAQEAMAH